MSMVCDSSTNDLSWMQVLTSDTVFSFPMTETYNLLGVDQKEIVTLEKYLQDYFANILKKLKDLKAQSKQTDIYFWTNKFPPTPTQPLYSI